MSGAARFSQKWNAGADGDGGGRSFGSGASPPKGGLPDLPQDEALEAADKIDAVLRRQGDPIHERLKESLTSTLRSRAKISRSLSDLDLPGAGARAEPPGGPRAFGQQLAATWRSLPDDRTPGVGGGRSFMLEQLDQLQAGRVRGLLTHLEYAVQADPSVKVSDLLAVATSTKAHWFDAPLPPPPPPPMKELGEITMENILNPQSEVDLFPREDAWPLQKIHREPRSRHSGKKGVFEIKGKPAEKLMAFRERLREAHGSLAEAFQMMDIENRGAISFDHFHAHLVRLKISRTDAEGSIRTMDIFKLLDADGNDIITPNDAIRSFAEAGKDVQQLRAEAEAIRKYDENAAAHGFKEGRAHIRFDKRLKLVGDDALRLSTLRRWLEGNYGGFIAGLRVMDVDNTAFIRKEEFVCSLVEGGYCHSAFEAMDLFRILDVHGYGSLSIEYLAKLEHGAALGAVAMEDRMKAGQITNLRSGIGSGGLFSDPGRLEGPKPPPRPHLRMQFGNSQVEADELYERLYTGTTKSYTKKMEMKKRASEAPHVIMDNFLYRTMDGPSTPGSAKSSSSGRFGKSSARSKSESKRSSEDAEKKDDSESSGSFFARWGMVGEDEDQEQQEPEKPKEPAKHHRPQKPNGSDKVEQKPTFSEKADEPGDSPSQERGSVVKAPKAMKDMAEKAKDADGASTERLVRRRAKLRSAARVGAAMFGAVQQIAAEIDREEESGVG